ncbi:MAG: DUF4271 domain-containing protein [Candidatus Symbiothrix sp.]|jgi:hypothetical protein|nr:DUF4271 domain-containing protein [Candidatus Symbiothrix sp.]
MTVPALLSEILANEPISPRIQFQNWGFLLFTVCFFIFVYAFSTGPKLLSGMLKGLWLDKARESIFAEPVENELIFKLLLCFQTIIIWAVNLFSCYLYRSGLPQEAAIEMFPFLIKASVLILTFLVYKMLVYNLAGIIFFQKENVRLWNEYFTSILCLSGFVLFIPTLLLFYIEKLLLFCSIFYLIYFIFIIVFIFRKIYVLFFPRKTLLLHFILYLCAQEIIPLYFLYKGLDYLFIVV